MSDFPPNDRTELPAPAGEEIGPGVRAVLGGLEIRFSRGGGPGGQNVNKVATRAELWLDLSRLAGLSDGAIERLKKLAGRRLTLAGKIHLVGENHRTQQANRSDVMDRLREMIVTAQVEPRPRRKTKPSKASKRRRLESKRHRSDVKSNRRDVE